MKKKDVLFITRAALTAALYVALTYLSSLVGLSSGVIQFRISEMLCILPLFFSGAVAGLTVGCALANLLCGAYLWDILFGTLATFIGALLARLLRKLPKKLTFITTLPTILANAIIVPFVLIYAYGAEGGYFYFMLTVGVGELVCATIGGTALRFALDKAKFSSDK